MTTMIKTHVGTLDGKTIGYSSDTEFRVQVGPRNGAYKTVFTCRGNLGRAVLYYDGISIDAAHKKRLISPHMNRPVLARSFGWR